MREYLLVWRALPRLLVGSIFLVEFALIVFGERALTTASLGLWRWLSANFSGATLLVAMVLVAGVGASLDLFLLQVASAVARTAARAFLRPVRLRQRISRLALPQRELFESPHATALRRFREKADFYVRFYELKSSSFSTEALAKINEMKNHFAGVREFVLAADPQDVEAVNYFALLGQDRRAYEIVESEIQALENLAIVLLCMPVLSSAVGIQGASLVITSFVFVALSFLILPEIVRKRRFLGAFLLTAFLDSFTVHEGADIADREGEVYF